MFALLATIANHMRFDHLPDNKKMLYPHPVSIEQNYANSIHLSDSQLNDLFRLIGSRHYLSNTIVIITGDHSFPMNEHGYTHSENGYFDESFRIPFLILWDGKLASRRVRDRAYSQVDLAPTILDLAGIHAGVNSFTGRSLFLKNQAEQPPVYLVQPYRGCYLQSIRYPYKFIYHKKSGTEYLFNLASDPKETTDILQQVPAELIARMRSDIDAIFFNQCILDANALYEKGGE